MAMKYFLRNFHFSAHCKLSTFSEKVQSDVDVCHCSQVVRQTERYFRCSASEFFVLTFNKALLVFERNFNIQTAKKMFCRRL